MNRELGYVAGAFLHAPDKSYSVRRRVPKYPHTHTPEIYDGTTFFLPSSSSLSFSCINPLEDPNSLLILSASSEERPSLLLLLFLSFLEQHFRVAKTWQTSQIQRAYFMSFNFLLSSRKNTILRDNK